MGWITVTSISFYPTEGADYYQLRAVAKLSEPFKTTSGRYCGSLTETYSVTRVGIWESGSFEDFLEQAKDNLKHLFNKRIETLNKSGA